MMNFVKFGIIFFCAIVEYRYASDLQRSPGDF
jgi:hypothetical protein